MNRAYAGVMGPLAYAAVVAQGVVTQGSLVATLQTACLCLFGFAALGYLIGQIADRAITESVRFQLLTDLKARETPAARATKAAPRST